MKRIPAWFAMIRKQFEKQNIKKTFLVLFFALLFVTPTILAGIYAYRIDHANKTNDFSVILYNRHGKELFRESGMPSDASDESLLAIFYDLTQYLKPMENTPSRVDGDQYVHAVTTLNGVSSEWDCYFSFIESESYCLDQTGKAYTVSAEESSRFLRSPYAEVFYSASTVPQLKTGNHDVILPNQVNWNYKNYEGNFQKAIANTTTEEILRYESVGEIGLFFETEPSNCQVRVYDETDTVLYEGSLQNLPYITVPSGNELTLQVRAEWQENDQNDFYGSVTYYFRLLISNRSAFTLSTDRVQAGEFTILSCTNVTDLSKIIFTTQEAVITPIFHRDGDIVRAILAIPQDTELTSFSFRIAYGASASEFTVTVTPNNTLPKEFLFSAATEKDSAWHAAKNFTLSALLHIENNQHAPIYFRGNFLSPDAYGFRMGYSHNSILYSDEEKTDSISALGTEYLTDDPYGIQVPVLHHGMVIQTGSHALLGNYVVVEHGCGLRTWYGHLSNIDVEVGDVLRQGESVGKTGDSGLATAQGFLLICTVYETPIDPSFLLGREITFS